MASNILFGGDRGFPVEGNAWPSIWRVSPDNRIELRRSGFARARLSVLRLLLDADANSLPK